MSAELIASMQNQLVDKPIIDDLNLTEEHFQGTLIAAGKKLSSGRADEALLDYASLVLISPQSVPFQIGLAESALQVGMLELALQSASFVMVAEPARPEGYLLSGKICLAMGEIQLALEHFNDALKMCEGNAQLSTIAKTAQQCIAFAAEH